MKLTVRESQLSDIENIVDYFLDSESAFLKGMGADKSKLPERRDWIDKLKLEFNKPYSKKEFYYVIWLLDDIPVGHSNADKIKFKESAKMHLHLWKTDKRKKGLGLEFLKLSVPYFFEKLEIEKLICEPYSENVAPNKTLIKYGFEFIRAYETTPGWINFKQVVNRYELTRQ